MRLPPYFSPIKKYVYSFFWVNLVALIQGILFWQWNTDFSLLSKDAANFWMVWFPFSALCFAPWAAFFLSEAKKNVRWWGAIACGVICIGIMLYQHWAAGYNVDVSSQISHWSLGDNAGYNTYHVTWYLALPFSLMLPFLQYYGKTGQWKISYRDYLAQYFNNLLLAIQTIGLLLIAGLTLILWMELFDLIGISFFKRLFHEDWFLAIGSCLFIAAVLTLPWAKQRLGTLSQWFATVLAVLLPVFSVIIILFVISLLFQGLKPLWSTGNTTPILLVTTWVMIISINCAYYIRVLRPYPFPINKIIAAAIVLLPVLSIISVYSTHLRIAEYGLTPSRVMAVLMLVVTASYTFSYAALTLFRKSLQYLGKVNIVLVIFTALIAILQLTFVLDTRRLAANSQLTRILQSNKPLQSAELRFIRRQLGRYGENLLTTLSQNPRFSENHKEIKALLETPVRDVSPSQSEPLPQKQTLESIRSHIESFPCYSLNKTSNESLPNDLVNELAKDWFEKPHKAIKDGAWVSVDLDRDGKNEIVIFEFDSSARAFVYENEQDAWKLVGRIWLKGKASQLKEKLENKDFSVVAPTPPRWNLLKIGNSEFDVKTVSN